MNLVADTAAIIACSTGEEERPAFMRGLARAERRIVSSVNLLKARIVITGTKSLPVDWLNDVLDNERIEIIPFDEDLSNLAFDAYRR